VRDFLRHWAPHPYQERALKFLLQHPSAALFLEPGLGKTSVVLAAVSILLRDVIDSALVVAPLRVVQGVWPAEVMKWAEFQNLKISIIHGTPKQRLAALEKDADLYLINPENVVWLTEQDWDPPQMLVLDESTKFKNSRAKRFRALKKWIKRGVFRRRVILTGTPAPNGYEDLFGQIYVLDCGRRLGEYITHYRMKYFTQDFNGFSWSLREGADKLIQDRVRDIVLMMKSEELVNMPELTQVRMPVVLPEKVYRKYQDLEDDFLIKIDDEYVTAFQAGVLSNKLRQMANGWVYDSGVERASHHVHDAKLEALADLKEELGAEPLLVAYEFKPEGEAIAKRLGCPRLGGGVSAKRGQEILEAWDRRELPALAIHPASGGHGLNLQQGGNHLAFFGLPWDLELHDQMFKRIWRQGQKNRVVVHYLLAQGTIDEVVYSVLVKKDRTQQDLLAAFK
jgi:SNF2 family DNA or RNA helicase